MDCVAPTLAAADANVDWTLATAEDYCRHLARSHYENFTVASWLLPRDLRQHFANVYAYCRTADDLADESPDSAENLRMLDAWEEQLHDCYRGRAEHPVFIALAETIREFDIPVEPFAALLTAFRQDQRVKRYDTIEELENYCHHSANPVGRIVLHMGRCCDDHSISLSDSICTGLQLINFCQDVARDWRERGRIYLPRQTLDKNPGSEQAILDGKANAAFRSAVAEEVGRGEGMLHNGWPLVRIVPAELKVDVELFIRGGLAVADAIRRLNFDVLTSRPVVGKWTKAKLFTTAVFRQRILRRH